MNILGVIPARGGSKGIPRKNIRELKGKPLLLYTAEVALQSSALSRVVLSTEDEEIAEIGRRCGVDVPFMRPAELASDDTPTLPVLQHAIRCLEELGERYDAVCLLQPTSPFRRVEDIDTCCRMLCENDADAVVTVLSVPHQFNPHWVYFAAQDGYMRLSTGGLEPIPRRQELPPAFHREGSVYVTRRDTLMEENSLFGQQLLGYEIDPARSVNIDRHKDWTEAEAFLERRSSH